VDLAGQLLLSTTLQWVHFAGSFNSGGRDRWRAFYIAMQSRPGLKRTKKTGTRPFIEGTGRAARESVHRQALIDLLFRRKNLEAWRGLFTRWNGAAVGRSMRIPIFSLASQFVGSESGSALPRPRGRETGLSPWDGDFPGEGAVGGDVGQSLIFFDCLCSQSPKCSHPPWTIPVQVPTKLDYLPEPRHLCHDIPRPYTCLLQTGHFADPWGCDRR